MVKMWSNSELVEARASLKEFEDAVIEDNVDYDIKRNICYGDDEAKGRHRSGWSRTWWSPGEEVRLAELGTSINFEI